jgi:hypothetical protein
LTADELYLPCGDEHPISSFATTGSETLANTWRSQSALRFSMIPTPPRALFGEFSDFGQTLREAGEFRFVPATVKLNGRSFTLKYPLADFLPSRIPSSLKAALKDDVDVNWVWAHLFRIQNRPAIFTRRESFARPGISFRR